MARALTPTQRALLQSPDIGLNVLATFYLDSGTYRFCDDVIDLYDGTYTYLGANAIAESFEVRSASDLAAEPATLICDGNRMAQYGIADPAKILREMLEELYHQRRVDFAFGYRYTYSKDVNLVIPCYAGKINYARLVDGEIQFADDGAQENAAADARLEIVLDSLASRYNRATFRTRSHQDQLEIDPTDNFYSFTVDATLNEKTLYWGKDAPINRSSNIPNTGVWGAGNWGEIGF